MKYYIQIFGCQMNYSDAERFAAKLHEIGYKEAVSDKEADLIVLITCSVRKSAEDRAYGAINNYHKKKLYPKLKKIILSGCMALRPEVIKKTDKVDIYMDIKDLNRLPELLNTKVDQAKNELESYFSIKPKYQSKFSAYVPIMTGCNNFCAYCIVPYVRGREESRQPQEILNEVKWLIDNGCKEIILLGQNVNSYKPASADTSTRLSMTASAIKDFPDLLEAVANLKGDFWLRFLTSHPKDFSDKLIKVVAQNEKITEYIHLPIQSGDSTILRKMNRKYNIGDYKNLIKKIRKAIPGVSVSTDIIVGFPGETKKLFENSAKIFTELSFDMAYINKYSTRAGTAAAKLKDNVTEAEKKRREKVLNMILKKTALKYNKQFVGKTLEVLVDKKGKADFWLGKTRTYKVVKFKSSKNLLGEFVKIKMTEAGSFGFEGEYVK